MKDKKILASLGTMVSGSKERHAGYPLHVHIFQSFPRVLKNSSFFHPHTYPSIELDSKI